MKPRKKRDISLIKHPVICNHCVCDQENLPYDDISNDIYHDMASRYPLNHLNKKYPELIFEYITMPSKEKPKADFKYHVNGNLFLIANWRVK